MSLRQRETFRFTGVEMAGDSGRVPRDGRCLHADERQAGDPGRGGEKRRLGCQFTLHGGRNDQRAEQPLQQIHAPHLRKIDERRGVRDD